MWQVLMFCAQRVYLNDNRRSLKNQPTYDLNNMKTKLSYIPMAFLLGIMFISAGCASSRVENTAPSTETEVALTHGNYKMIKAGAEGRSYGFRFFLGIIPITAPNTAAARADLYQSVGQSLTGRSVALVNVTEDRSTTWLLLFSIPKIVITGDVVEFTQDNSPVQPVSQVVPANAVASPQ
jgi:hypothetical protein